MVSTRRSAAEQKCDAHQVVPQATCPPPEDHQRQQQQTAELEPVQQQDAAAPATPTDSKAGAPDGFSKLPKLRAALELLQLRLDDPAVFLRPSSEVALAAREATKLLYKQCAGLLLGAGGGGKRAERRALLKSPGGPLPELHTDASFDPEQIWLQLELATEATVRRVRRLIKVAEPLGSGGNGRSTGLVTAAAAAGIDRLLGSSDEDEDEEVDEDEEGDEIDGSSSGEGSEGEEEDSDGEERRTKKARREDGVQAKGKTKGKAQPRQSGRLEDRFFRLSDMERYVEDAERRAMADDEDGDEGLFGEAEEEEDEEDSAGLSGGKKKRKVGEKDAAEIRYKDFFGGGGGMDEEKDEDEDEDDEDEDEGGAKGLKRGRGALLSSEDGEGEDEEDEEEDGDEEGGGAARRRSGRDAGPRDASADEGPGGQGGKVTQQQREMMSSHERRLARMQERVAELEMEALGDKAWHLTGEVMASSRPINSALELDMDFETTAKPAPVQTEEMTNDLEVMIKKRIADHRFDDVIRVVPPPVEAKKKDIELDDTKAKSGLGELYEQDYVRKVMGGTSEDKDEKLRQEARTLFKVLCGKLDALCRFHYAPKPVVEDMTIRSEVPAIVMEEAAPVAVSKAAMQLPGEVYQPGAKDGRPVAEGELTKEERKQRRAKKKRQRKAKEEAKEVERRAKAVSQGGSAELVGRKSDSKVVASKGVKVVEGAGAGRHGRTDLGNSSAVFAKLAAEQKMMAAGGGAAAAKVARELKKKVVGGQEGGKKGAASLKL